MQDNMILRPLDPGEAFFYLSDHVSCMNFVVLAERRGHLQPERIRQALDAIQLKHQLLQARIRWTEEDGLCFVHAPGQVIELHCHTVTADNWQTCIEDQLSHPFAEGAAPLMRCLYLELAGPDDGADSAGRSVLALSFHHSIGDGRSGTHLLQGLLAHIATGTTAHASAAATALPAMVDVHPPRYRWAEQPEAAKQLKYALMGDYRRHGPLPTIPWLASEASGRTPRFVRLSLPAEVTRGLITLARQHGTSVHGALCAAQLMAQYKLQTATDPVAYFLSCPVDMRAHLEPVQPVTPTGLFVSLIAGTYLVSADTDLWALAREVITQTRLQLARGEGHLLFNLYGLDGSLIAPSHLAPFRKKALASLPNTMISNVGAVAEVADDPAVDAISFALCPMPYQTLFTAASSYKNQLILNVGFDAQRLSEANAHALVDGIRTLLLAAVTDTRP